MDETIDHQAVITQLQLENELLRSNMRIFLEARGMVLKVPDLFLEYYHKLMANKYSIVMALMIVYWALEIGITLYDRIGRRM